MKKNYIKPVFNTLSIEPHKVIAYSGGFNHGDSKPGSNSEYWCDICKGWYKNGHFMGNGKHNRNSSPFREGIWDED